MTKTIQCPSSWTIISAAPRSSAWKNMFFAVVLFFGISTTAYAQNFDWAIGIGGSDLDYGRGIAIDNIGNVYVVGQIYSDTVDFDPGPGVINLTANSTFIAKYSSSGSYIWAKGIGGSQFVCTNDIAIDDSNNVYVTGGFDGTADFDPGPGTAYLTGSDMFFAKYSSSGDYIWAKSVVGTPHDPIHITVSDSNSIFITYSPWNIYISKYSSSGDSIWTKGISGSEQVVNSIAVDSFDNVYITGSFKGVADFDPGPAIVNLTSNHNQYTQDRSTIFVAKYSSSGDYIWAKSVVGNGYDIDIDQGYSITIDDSNNVYITGCFTGIADFDLGPDTISLTGSLATIFFAKYSSSGDYIWAKSIVSTLSAAKSNNITIDNSCSIYVTGYFANNADFDPGPGVVNLITPGTTDLFVAKYSSSGDYIWAKDFRSSSSGITEGKCLITNSIGDVYVTGWFKGTTDFDPGPAIINIVGGSANIFVFKLKQRGVQGMVYNDFNQDCIQNINEPGLSGQRLIIQPGNYIIQTNAYGVFFIDSLLIGNYTVTIDTTNPLWLSTCPVTQSFTVSTLNQITQAPSFGLIPTQPCSDPDISILAPILRPGMNTTIYVTACNQLTATGILDTAYAEVQLPPLITLQSATLPYTSLGGNLYRFDLGNLNPGQCISWTISAYVDLAAILGQTLCMEATLYPIQSCLYTYDTIPDLPPGPTGGVTPCTLPWDKSSLSVDGWCQNDSVYFTITNTGDPLEGDMDCWAPVRIYIDGVLTQLDSIQLQGGQTITYVFAGNGWTWRLEADQHPLHPGNSHPNAVVEFCGDSLNWTPGGVTTQYQDDADPVVDIYCGIVTGSYDPNDKTGYPTGVGVDHYIYPNQQLQYMIRFQNTGNDTAFTVVIRDTLDPNLNIFTVTPGVASHPYTFQMYGQRVLEWTFDNILLPDSNVNEPASHGFVTFTVDQNTNLPFGTQIRNEAGIYFDFNAPVITNQTIHTLYDFSTVLTALQPIKSWDELITVYPNPTSSDVTITFPELQENAEFIVMDMLGQKVYSTNLSKGENSYRMSVEGYPQGLYFVVINASKKISVSKLIVNG